MNDLVGAGLGGALRELAREVESPRPADPAALWSRGRARVRRGRVAAAVMAVLAAALVGSGTLVVVPPSTVIPAGSRHDAAIPRNVWPAKGWFPGTEDDPPGVVAVMGGVARDGGNGLFVVSAGTGDYRLLDLPDLADLQGDESAALSPDGRHIAYWLTGKPAGTVFPEGILGDLPIGVGVYDTESGTVQRYLPQTEHGISADDLLWVDDEHLLLTYGQRTGSTSSRQVRTFTWRPGRDPATGGRTQPVAKPGDPLFVDPMRSKDGGLLAEIVRTDATSDVRSPRYGNLTVTGEVGRETVLELPLPRDVAGEAASYTGVSHSVDYLVASLHRESGEDGLWAARVGSQGAQFGLIEGLGLPTFVGWLADDRILVMGGGEGDEDRGFFEVDLRTLEHARLGTAEGALYSPGLSFATDLLSSPMADGDRPPRVDPRWIFAGVAAGGVLVAWFVLPFLLRRRRD